MCLGYRTYDTFDGTIVRTQIAGSPAVTADYTFTEGVDIYRATESTTILEARNRVIVAGFPGYDGKHEIKYTASGANAFLLNPDTSQWYLAEKISSPP